MRCVYIYIVIMYTYHPEIMFGCWRLMISSGLSHLPGFLGSLLRGPFATAFFGLEWPRNIPASQPRKQLIACDSVTIARIKQWMVSKWIYICLEAGYVRVLGYAPVSTNFKGHHLGSPVELRTISQLVSWSTELHCGAPPGYKLLCIINPFNIIRL